MSLIQQSSPGAPEVKGQPRTPSSVRKRLFRILLLAILLIAVVIGWQFLNVRANSTDPAVAGRPLSNPHTHLHVVALVEQHGNGVGISTGAISSRLLLIL